MGYLELATNHIAGIIEFELKIIKHELIRLKEKILIDLRTMQIDSPSNFQSNLTAALAIFVNTDFLAVDEFVMTEGI